MNKRIRMAISGRVQGVGFRPAVFRHASELDVAGFVRNSSGGVIIECEGDDSRLGAFIERVQHRSPPQAVIYSVAIEEVPPTGERTFQIVQSVRSADVTVGMPPDLAVCEVCVKELFSPGNRRRGYPFINCTNCGPRFTIIDSLPYDRERTSMAEFTMCPKCSREYRNPHDRRFDAQPDACAACGPALGLLDAHGLKVECDDPLRAAITSLAGGHVIAVKGIGGYHLCCDAMNDFALQLLRDRKRRPHKALAVMFKSLRQVEEFCEAGEVEKAALLGPQAPVVVLKRKAGTALSGLVSPDTGDVGAVLPYSPLHHLLLAGISPLVMTSGNVADEPMAVDENGLGGILGAIAAVALTHNRPILRRCDDSVLKIAGRSPLFLRRSRGYVPDVIEMPVGGPPVLACGGDLKNTFCLTRGRQAVVSQHIGDLEEWRSFEFYRQAADDLAALLEVKPGIVVHDMHPDYRSTRYAIECGAAQLVAVQHHHAHIAACMAEHRLAETVIGVALDGTGLGDDGTLWGGEILVSSLSGSRRAFHFKQYPMPGGEEAILNPDRMAFSCLYAETAGDMPAIAGVLEGMKPADMEVLEKMISGKLLSPMTSSAGRLFDAVSAMLGLCTSVTYEGQAAVRLQYAATPGTPGEYPFGVAGGVLDFGPTILAIAGEIAGDAGAGRVSAMFHNTLAVAVATACEEVRQKEKTVKVVLSGGVFQNDLLLSLLTSALKARGFEVFSHHLLPPNDACLCLGQAVTALARMGQ
ncbi:MAG: carbamoyltransferase HypF [bacterium]